MVRAVGRRGVGSLGQQQVAGSGQWAVIDNEV
jgi:hypothetical protein